MKFRATSVLVALPAIITGLLVAASPAQATHSAFVSTTNVAINSDGIGKVYMSCHSSHTCKGTLYFNAAGTRYRSYSVSGNTSKYVEVATRTTEAAYPYASNGGTNVGHPDYYSKSATLFVNEDYPRNYTHSYPVTTETPVTRQSITGQVSGPAGMTSLRVDLRRILSGGNDVQVKGQYVPNGGTYRLDVNLGTNNSPSSNYQLRVSGIDQDGEFRSWYWRGSDGIFTGGGRYLRDASTVRARKDSDFNANVYFASISGQVTKTTGQANAEVTVAAPPPTYGSSNSVTLRELDIPRCANVFGRTTTNSSGFYTVNFLPATTSADNRYMVGAKYGSARMWRGRTGEAYGSCYDATDYAYSKTNLITLSGSVSGQNVSLNPTGNDIKVNGQWSGFTPTSSGDRWIRLREAVPGLAVMDAPVITEGQADSSLNREFTNLRPGKYWVEVSRRTGCSGWYPSVYPDNNAYFKGEDRASERWKTVSGKYPEYQRSYDNGYVAKTPPSGYRGWMYRSYCKAYSAGTINSMTVNGVGNVFTKDTSTGRKGAVVHGHVSRSGGRTNKEMMVRLSSSGGTLVLRTDLTDSGGNFYVAGLASGTYTISVNSDSWRGIGRTFYGRHTITVSAGHSYGVGTLSFRG